MAGTLELDVVVRSLLASLGALVVLVAVEGSSVLHGSVGLYGQQRHAHARPVAFGCIGKESSLGVHGRCSWKMVHILR